MGRNVRRELARGDNGARLRVAQDVRQLAFAIQHVHWNDDRAELERRKLLTRRVNRADLREAFLSLTPAGRAVYDELAPRALEFTQRLSEVVAPADRAAFDRAMTALTERSAKLVEAMELAQGPGDDRMEP